MQNIHRPLHQKYRPKNLDELVGQEFISITLKQALLSQKIAPAYLFNGPRGTGKTSSARIFAKSLNCLSFESPTDNPCGNCELCVQINEGNALDIIEIDAASNTGVENIREIIERARFTPSQARWKVYVIDECHMLSTAASNALLKTIEEPPSRVVFILATTNPERVLTTIQSRCQKFDFKRISSNDIFQHLSEIANRESIKYEDQALKLIAKRSNGGMRDAQSTLDQLSLFKDGITSKNVRNLLGEVSEIDLINLIDSLIKNNPGSLLISCNKLFDNGNEPMQIITGLLNITRDLLLFSINNNYSELYYTSFEFQNELSKFANAINKSRIIDWHNKLKNVEYQIKTSENPRLWLEIHLTSLLDKQEIEIIDDKKGEIFNKNDENQRDPENINNQEFIKEPNIANNEKTQNQLNRVDDLKVNTQAKTPDKNINDNKPNTLKEKWELILSKLELPSTRMLLSQQAELVSLNSNEVEIALSPNWENMIKSRKVLIETTVKTIFGEEMKLRFSSKQINKNNNLRNPQNKGNEKIKDDESTQKIKGGNPNLSNNLSKENDNNNSSKNLANFFNGEVIELDE